MITDYVIEPINDYMPPEPQLTNIMLQCMSNLVIVYFLSDQCLGLMPNFLS